MKTMVIEEQAIFALEYWDYEYAAHLSVYVNDLRNAEVGDVFEPDVRSNCGRGVHQERLKVVYKDATGIAAVYSVSGTTDNPSPEEWVEEDTLVWFDIM